MAEKKQWGLRVEDQLIDRLNDLAPKCGYSSANELAVDMLDTYAELFADLMMELRQVERETIKRQREELLAKFRQVRSSGSGLDREEGKSRRK